MDRDSSIIAQNAGTTAATIVGPYKGGDLRSYLDRYDVVREHVYDGTMVLANGNSLTEAKPEDVSHDVPVTIIPDGVKVLDPAEVEKAFETPPPPKQEQGSVSFKIIEKDSTGQPAPDWLEREITYQINAGKIAPDDTELWDNRGRLPQFGGTGSAQAPWFRTSKAKVGLWPPRPKK